MMEQKPLTKSQRRRARERQQKELARQWQETMGPAPELPRDLEMLLGRNIPEQPPEPINPWERAPSHMVDYDECPGLNAEALARLSEKAGDRRTDERSQRINDLRLKYPNHWGKRGGAKYIALTESDTGDPISERTVLNYFKEK
jgi:hypothetical protein